MATLQSTKAVRDRMMRYNTLDQVRGVLGWTHEYYMPSELIDLLRFRINYPMNHRDPSVKAEMHQDHIRMLNLIIATEFMIEHDLTEEEFLDPVNQMLFAIQHPEAKL